MSELKTDPTPSAIYARVSPTVHLKTANDIHQSIEETIKICKKDAEREGNPVVAIYIDEYVSGKDNKKMVEFQRMKKDAIDGTNTAKEGDHKTPWKRIYFRRVDRAGRNRDEIIIAQIELTKAGIGLKFVEDGLDTDKPFAKSMIAFLAEYAQEGRDRILENTKRGRDDVLSGKKPTKTGKPFGHPKKELNVNLIRMARKELPIKNRQSWKSLEQTFNASRTIMIQRLKDAGYWDDEKGCVK